MKYLYEEVLKNVGEFGVWQRKSVLILWYIMFICGMEFIMVDYMSLKPPEYLCKFPLSKCEGYNTSFFLNRTVVSIADSKGRWEYQNDHVFPHLAS